MVVSWKDDGSFDCPHCGATVTAEAKRCRGCGADANCGWGEDYAFDGGEGLEDEFDYDDFVAREFPDQVDPTKPDSQKWVKLIMLLVIISIILSMAL